MKGPKMNATTKEAHACPKCDGKGRIIAFGHYAAGVCFECGGSKVIYLDPMTDSQRMQAIMSAEYGKAVIALAQKIGIDAGSKFYNRIGNLILGAHAERGTWAGWGNASPGSMSAKFGKQRSAFYQQVVDIIDEAVTSRSIRPSQVAKLAEMADEREGFQEFCH